MANQSRPTVVSEPVMRLGVIGGPHKRDLCEYAS